MKHVIKSKKLGRVLTFTRPGSAYVFVDINGRAGTNGVQPCRGGGFMGSTLWYEGDSEDEFAAFCRRWYRAHLRREIAP